MRDITINASSGTVTAAERPVVRVVASTPVITLTPSATTLQTSGSIKVTALVVDGSNNAVRNARVNFDGGTGVIVLDGGNLTDINGMVTATLTAGTNSTLRDVTVTATLDQASGVATPATTRVAVVTARPTLQLTASSGIIATSGAAGTEVILTVLARDANNNVVPGLKINFAADSGVLSVTGDQRTNAQGIVTERLSVANNPANRTIKITATATGADPSDVTVLATGTMITISSGNTVNAGVVSPLTVRLADSGNTPLRNIPLEISTTNGGQLRVKGNGPAVTDTNGQLELEYTSLPTQTSERIFVRGLAAVAFQDLIVNNNVFSVQGDGLSKGDINICYPIVASSNIAGAPSVGQLAFSASRGSVFSDATCATMLNSSLPLVNGMARAFVRATSPGIATLVATLTSSTGVVSSARGGFEFVAPLGAAPRITLQSDPSVVGPIFPLPLCKRRSCGQWCGIRIIMWYRVQR